MNVRVIGKSLQFSEDSVSVAGIDLGNGLAALLVITAAISKTTFTAQAASQALLAANASAGGRKAAIVANNGTTNLHVVIQSDTVYQTPAVEVVLAPGQSFDTPDNYQGRIDGWMEGTPTGTITVTEIA